MGGLGFWSLLINTLVLSRFVEVVDAVWYWGGGGGSFVGNPIGWTILIGLNLVLQEFADAPMCWLESDPDCTDDDWQVVLFGWDAWVIVIKLVLLPLVFVELVFGFSSINKIIVLVTDIKRMF